MHTQSRLLALALLAACTAAPAAQGQPAFPRAPVAIVVPYGPGGGADFFARTIGPKMAESLGQPVVIENKPGGGTAIAASDVARAKPDGYRLLLGDVSTFSTNPSLYKRLIYNPAKDFASISLAGRSPYLLLVNPRVHPQDTLAGFVNALKQQPAGTVSYGSAGNGGPAHLAAEMFVRAAGVQMMHIPYKGSGPALPDLLGGHIGMMFMDYAPAKAQLDGKHLRALAVTSPQASEVLPDVPAMADTYPGFEAWFWTALAAPAGTPAPVLDRLRSAYRTAVNDPETRRKLVEAGIEPLQTSGPEMDTFIRSEAERLGKVIRDAGIQLD